jgi:hydrogenase maturation factor
VTLVDAKKGQFVEVFGNMALSLLTPAEARIKKRAWVEVARAVAAESSGES